MENKEAALIFDQLSADKVDQRLWKDKILNLICLHIILKSFWFSFIKNQNNFNQKTHKVQITTTTTTEIKNSSISLSPTPPSTNCFQYIHKYITK